MDYIMELRHIAATCDWTKAQLDNNIHDKFIMGLHNEYLLQQLLSQDHKKPLDDLLELAHTFKAAKCELLKVASDSDKRSTDSSSVAATKPKPQNPIKNQ